ncbi:hypothetical protein [Nostoc sp.]|uniref:hypothetical protein n=1 Tax=Nostoc sp. TaxID=1180 RepID=UPI002FF9E6EB
MDDPIDRKIQQANERLTKKGSRVKIYRRGSRLWLRGTLPPKLHITGKDKDYSQFVSLGNNAIAIRDYLIANPQQILIIIGLL